MDVDAIAAEVANAVGLAEGPAGVTDVLREIARREPVPTREVARGTHLPVPIVAAICNELRTRGVLDRSRPVRLTDSGRASLGEAHARAWGDAGGSCPHCGGLGVAVAGALAPLAADLARAAASEPPARLDLDQTHCSVDTKLRRVLAMHEAGALGGRRVILLGDDDLVSLAIAAFAAQTGPAARPRQLTVVDCDTNLLRYLAGELARLEMAADVVEHDLRHPLPPALRGVFDVACTDPPYTVAGAGLFLSRAVEALAGGGGRHLFFSFGARKPEETLATQRLLADLGLAVAALVPRFNTYEGAGILAGVSHLYHLRTTAASEPVVTGSHLGQLYTADGRVVQARPYRCAGCGAVHLVGPGEHWAQIAELKAAGCPDCGGTVLRPQPRKSRQPGAPVTVKRRDR